LGWPSFYTCGLADGEIKKENGGRLSNVHHKENGGKHPVLVQL
jgi:translation initiation factor 2 beta subunit (eIF-2beta)/eIF-5